MSSKEWKMYERMITCKKHHLEQRCKQRGYTLEEVMDCVVKQDGDTWTIDTMHEKYPMFTHPEYKKHLERRAKYVAPPHPDGGPGTELKKLLKMIGITASPTCSCNSRATKMDEMGIQWCKDNESKIVDWLAEEAKKRKLPFIRVLGKKIVRMAIRAAEKKKK